MMQILYALLFTQASGCATHYLQRRTYRPTQLLLELCHIYNVIKANANYALITMIHGIYKLHCIKWLHQFHTSSVSYLLSSFLQAVMSRASIVEYSSYKLGCS
jgi:hypothetical protein